MRLPSDVASARIPATIDKRMVLSKERCALTSSPAGVVFTSVSDARLAFVLISSETISNDDDDRSAVTCCVNNWVMTSPSLLAKFSVIFYTPN